VTNPFEILEAKIDALTAKIDALEARLAPQPVRTHEYVNLGEYAKRIACSLRHVKDLRREGLPCIGEGRALRVDVRAADEWMRRRAAKPTLEEVARAQARGSR